MYSSLNVIIRMVLKCVSHSVSDEQVSSTLSPSPASSLFQHAICRVLFHDLDVHRKGYLTVHDFLAAVESQSKREELESIFLALPLSFPTDQHTQLLPTLTTSLSCSSVPIELQSRRSFSLSDQQQSSDSSLHLPPANPTLSSSTSSTKLSSIFKFLAPSKSTVSQAASIDRSHSGDDRMSGSGSSAGGVERDDYERDVLLTYNDFIASFLCHQ
jgi:hypothetical protein